VTTIVKAISASPAMMTKPRRDDRRESASSQRSSKGKSENNILPVRDLPQLPHLEHPTWSLLESFGNVDPSWR
jgi:hypothetical protein